MQIRTRTALEATTTDGRLNIMMDEQHIMEFNSNGGSGAAVSHVTRPMLAKAPATRVMMEKQKGGLRLIGSNRKDNSSNFDHSHSSSSSSDGESDASPAGGNGGVDRLAQINPNTKTTSSLRPKLQPAKKGLSPTPPPLCGLALLGGLALPKVNPPAGGGADKEKRPTSPKTCASGGTAKAAPKQRKVNKNMSTESFDELDSMLRKAKKEVEDPLQALRRQKKHAAKALGKAEFPGIMKDGDSDCFMKDDGQAAPKQHKKERRTSRRVKEASDFKPRSSCSNNK